MLKNVLQMKKYFKGILIILVMITDITGMKAGPPYLTDDPDPVKFHHWEFYLSTQHIFDVRNSSAAGSLPQVEINYGVVPNVQLHLVVPLAYQFSSPHCFEMGYTSTEAGIKYRFVKEKKNIPEIGVFPVVEIPTISDPRFADQKTQVFLPVWFQKSWNKFTSYGGAGYWINPGSGNKNWVFAGWQAQYDFSEFLTLGSELYYHTAPTTEDKSITGFTIGGSLNFTEHMHLIFSGGHSIVNENLATAYVGLYITY